MKFQEVSRKDQCAICGRTRWCSYSVCGEFVICRREHHDGAIIKKDKNGEIYYLYRKEKVTLC